VAALLGPNGSGKSTVMRMVTGYFSPTSGAVRVAGVDMAVDSLRARRRIGYLPEQVTLYPDLTVRRYLSFVAGVRGLRGGAARRAVDEALARCHLGEVADRLAGKLSKGYRQRVGLAQALLGDPEVLVLDEPTVGLDPVQTVELRELIRGLSGRTVLLSTHVLSEASQLCTRVVILARGRLVAEDTTGGLVRRLAELTRLTVRVEGPAAAVERALAALPGVVGVERLAVDAPGEVAFVVLAPDPRPVQQRLAAAMVAGGWPLLELRAAAPGLEDLFVRLVTTADGG
jgi:ABC-2 type transport system ATP-binding protein